MAQGEKRVSATAGPTRDRSRRREVEPSDYDRANWQREAAEWGFGSLRWKAEQEQWHWTPAASVPGSPSEPPAASSGWSAPAVLSGSEKLDENNWEAVPHRPAWRAAKAFAESEGRADMVLHQDLPES